jgi:TetR/AcrR family transcriptional regulator, transcriptional repressor for nem operon
MGKPWQKERKLHSRARIVGAASRLLFSRGLHGTSVGRLMKEAGLTVGGFYAHFRSKEELVLESFRAMLKATQESLQQLPGPNRRAAFRAIYLSDRHRDHPESGCPVLALAFETAGQSASFRRKFAAELGRTLTEREKIFGSHEPRAEVLREYSLLIGAQLLARATAGTPLSDEVLHAAREGAH